MRRNLRVTPLHHHILPAVPPLNLLPSYDVTRRETFEQLFQWVRLVADARKGLKPLKATVVANKLDVQVIFPNTARFSI